jgi:hypothetical protein
MKGEMESKFDSKMPNSIKSGATRDQFWVYAVKVCHPRVVSRMFRTQFRFPWNLTVQPTTHFDHICLLKFVSIITAKSFNKKNYRNALV